MKIVALTFVVALSISAAANAAIINFDIQGKAGAGLLAGNENGVVNGTPGSGGEVGNGIFFDDVTLQLTINIGWGSGKGFTNLTGNASGHHIHGPTASAAPTSFNENATILFPLDTNPGPPAYNNSGTNGGFNGTITLTATQRDQLYAGRYYLNVHTTTNGGGEIRGQLMQVPEPASFVLLAMGAGGAGFLAARRRKRV